MNDVTAVPLRLSGAELVALVGLVDNPAAEEVGRRLRLDSIEDVGSARRFGVSALVARGLAEVYGASVSSANEATVIATIIATAESFIEVGLVSPTQSEGALFVVGERGSLMFGASAAETYECIALRHDADLGTVLGGMVFAFLDAHDVAAAAVTATRSGMERHVAVRRSDTDSWEVAAGSPGDSGLLPVVGTTREAALQRVSDAWSIG